MLEPAGGVDAGGAGSQLALLASGPPDAAAVAVADAPDRHESDEDVEELGAVIVEAEKPVDAGDEEAGPEPLGWKARARAKKEALVQRTAEKKRQLQARAREIRRGELPGGKHGGRFTSEAALDGAVVTAQLWLLVVAGGCAALASCPVRWGSASAGYLAPLDRARGQIDVRLSLWSGAISVRKQPTDPLPPPPPPAEAGTGGPAAANATAPAPAPPPALPCPPSCPAVTPPPPPPRTASGEMVQIVGVDIGWGEVGPLAPGMHPVVAEAFKLNGQYQLPPADGALWAARIALLGTAILSAVAARRLRALRRLHRLADVRSRRRYPGGGGGNSAAVRARQQGGQLLLLAAPPSTVALVQHTRLLMGLTGVAAALGFALAYNSTVAAAPAQVARICALFGALECATSSSAAWGAGVGLLGGLSACIAASLGWFTGVGMPPLAPREMGELRDLTQP
jgi:hypothetical protein